MPTGNQKDGRSKQTNFEAKRKRNAASLRKSDLEFCQAILDAKIFAGQGLPSGKSVVRPPWIDRTCIQHPGVHPVSGQWPPKMSLKDRISDDVFIRLLKANDVHSNPDSLHLIFFLPGNPGLLSYYHEFFALLAESEEASQYVIAGMSLAGFEAEGSDLDWNDEDLLFPDVVAAKRSAKRRGEEHRWWGLEEQIDLTVSRIDEVVRRMHKKGPAKVTLMGHSLGTYMSLEVIRKVSERAELLGEPGLDSSGVLGVGQGNEIDAGWKVEACVALAPTIIELAKSTSGVKVAPLLSAFTFLPWLLQILVGGLTWVSSRETIAWMVARFLNLPAETPGVLTTARFLSSSAGVRQSLELAKQELVSISRDDWGPEVWGAGPALQMGGLDQFKGPKLFFLFAQMDHWIADITRDKILSTRTRQAGHGEFIVDEKNGLKHAWCLTQNRAVAEYVRPWLLEIVERK